MDIETEILINTIDDFFFSAKNKKESEKRLKAIEKYIEKKGVENDRQ